MIIAILVILMCFVFYQLAYNEPGPEELKSRKDKAHRDYLMRMDLNKTTDE